MYLLFKKKVLSKNKILEKYNLWKAASKCRLKHYLSVFWFLDHLNTRYLKKLPVTSSYIFPFTFSYRDSKRKNERGYRMKPENLRRYTQHLSSIICIFFYKKCVIALSSGPFTGLGGRLLKISLSILSFKAFSKFKKNIFFRSFLCNPGDHTVCCKQRFTTA